MFECWWLGHPCFVLYTPTMATLMLYGGYKPSKIETRHQPQTKTYSTKCQCQNRRLPLPTHWRHGRNEWTYMQMGWELFFDWCKRYSVQVLEPHYRSTIYPKTSPDSGWSLIYACLTNRFEWGTYISWNVDHRLLVENTGNLPCIRRDCSMSDFQIYLV